MIVSQSNAMNLFQVRADMGPTEILPALKTLRVHIPGAEYFFIRQAIWAMYLY